MTEIALLHHVREDQSIELGPLADYAVTPAELEAYLHERAGWQPVSEPDKLGEMDGKGVLLTFDDGYRNNLTEALPIVEKHGIPCLLFLTTAFIDGVTYPYEIELAKVVEEKDRLLVPTHTDPIELQETSDKQSLYDELRRRLKPKTDVERKIFMDRLSSQNRYKRAEMQSEELLDWQEVITLSNHPLITIGAHTVSHVPLSDQSWNLALKEIQSSIHKIEKKVGVDVKHFSYPYGDSSFVVRQIARTLGVKYAFTTEKRRLRNVNPINRLSLPRIDIS